MPSGPNPLSLAALDSSPDGGGLGKTGRSCSHSLTAGRSLPLSCKLFALVKASPFREWWHGEAVTERVSSGTNPLSLAALDSSPEGGALGKEGRFRPHRLLARKSLPLSCKLFALAKASPVGERWHGDSSPEGGALGKEGRSRPPRLLARKSLPLSCKLFALAKASPFRERWHGEAVTERVASRTNPLSRLRRQLPRRWSPWQRGQVSSSFVNGRRSQPISGKLYALAKASPFGERWHGEAVTERVEPPPSAILWPSGASRL